MRDEGRILQPEEENPAESHARCNMAEPVDVGRSGSQDPAGVQRSSVPTHPSRIFSRARICLTTFPPIFPKLTMSSSIRTARSARRLTTSELGPAQE